MAEPTFRCGSCGRGFRWKPALAGKQTNCKCGAPLTVPNTPDGPVPGPEPDDGTIPLAESPDAVAFAERVAASSAAGAASAGRTKCVNCNAPLKPGVVLCVRCGVNQTDGQKIDTQTGEEFVDPDGAEPFDPRSLGDVSRGSERERTRKLSYADDADAAYASTGMVCIELGLWAALASIVCTAVGVALSVAGAFVRQDLAAWIALSAVASAGLNIAAVVLMLFVPKAAGARWLLVTALGCLLGSVVAAIFTTGIWDTSFSGLTFALASGLLSFLAVILFLIFLKQLADFFGFGEVTQKADKVISLYIVLAIGQFAVCLPFVGIIVAILAVYTFWMYVSLLIDLHRAARYRRTHGTQ